jgi:DNA-binding GntR family transcriptional regulator
VAENLRGLIISGRMAPGELYSAPRLAERFGVSATPVREAMLDLVAEGHVVPVKNKGFRIVELSARELDELAEIRRLVEPPAMGMVATSAAEDPALRERIEELRPTARAIVDAARERDFARYIDLDTRFHLEFLALHGNGTLVTEVRSLRRRSRLLGLEEMAEADTLVTLAEEHEQMVEAGLQGDTATMVALVTAHIDHVRREWAGTAG